MTTKTGKEPKSAIDRLGGKTRKGAPNKNTAQLKEMILEALDKAGGVAYLLGCANNEKTQGAFLSLIGKVLPMTIQGPGADGEHVFTVIERRIVKAGN